MDAVAVERVVVALGGAEHALAVLSFADRRARKATRKQWLLVRGLERVLYGVHDACRSTGAFGAHLSKCTMRDAVLVCEKQSVADDLLTEAELDAGARAPPPPAPTASRAAPPLAHEALRCRASQCSPR